MPGSRNVRKYSHNYQVLYTNRRLRILTESKALSKMLFKKCFMVCLLLVYIYHKHFMLV